MSDTLLTRPADSPGDRREAIIAAAYDVFIAYGFRKTSMDDIARAAGMSRPALYQDFRNKTDIFRALSRSFMVRCTQAARASFDTDQPFRDQLHRAFEVSIFDLIRRIRSTQHGLELMGVNAEIAGDIQCEWRDLMARSIGEGIALADARGEISLERAGVGAEELGRLVTDCVEGIKDLIMRGDDVEDRVRVLLTFVVRAVAPA